MFTEQNSESVKSTKSKREKKKMSSHNILSSQRRFDKKKLVTFKKSQSQVSKKTLACI